MLFLLDRGSGTGGQPLEGIHRGIVRALEDVLPYKDS